VTGAILPLARIGEGTPKGGAVRAAILASLLFYHTETKGEMAHD
jgi:hypothetical protein